MFNFERSLRRLIQEVEARKRQEPQQARLRLEVLEDRAVPATFYVSLSGDDSNDGLTAGQAFKSIQVAINAAAAADDGDDQINVAGGTYSAGQLSIPNSANVTNLKLLGGWDATFATRNPAVTPTDYTFNVAPIPASPYDLQVLDNNVVIDGFTWRSSDGTTPRNADTILVNGAQNVTISNNIIFAGIRNGGSRPAAIVTGGTDTSGLLIEDNTINVDFTGLVSTTSGSIGIFLNPSSQTGTITIQDNTINGNNLQTGVVVSGVNNVTIQNNTINRNTPLFGSGIEVRNSSGTVNNTQILSNTILDTSLSLSNTSAGIQIGASGGLNANVTNTAIRGNLISMSGTLSAAVFAGLGAQSSSTLIERNSLTAVLAGGSVLSSVVGLDVSGNWFGSAVASTVNAAISATGLGNTIVAGSFLSSGTDADGSAPGFQLPTSTEMLVPQRSAISLLANVDGRIQSGVNRAVTGMIVRVAADTFVEDVTINTSGLSLLGSGVASTTISGAIGGGSATVQIGASNVTVAGFTITRQGNNTTDWNNPGLNTAGIAIQGLANTNALIRDNLITGNRTGVDINNSGSHTIRNNVIDNNRTGLLLRNQTDNLLVTQNEITNNWTLGVLFLDASGGTNSPVQQASGSVFTNNNISANWYGQVEDRQVGGSLPTPGTTNLKNFSGNWFGTATPTVTATAGAEPGYAMQIPVAFGGTAVAPGGQPDLLGLASANIDYSPLLVSGTDTNVETNVGWGTYGFQGNFNLLQVTTAGAQVGSLSRIQEGIDRATSGGTVRVLTGTYAGNVDATSNSVTLVAGNGTAPGQVTVNGNFTLSNNDTVAATINGKMATDYTSWSVNGGVTLGGATLTVNGSYVPVAGDVFNIVPNDSNDSVGGLFGSFAEGSVITTLNGQNLEIFYTGVDGNDVILAQQTPTTVYVSNDPVWLLLSLGSFITDADFGTAGNQSAIFGLNAFTTLGAALTNVAAGGTIIVNAGTYTETINLPGGGTNLIVTGSALAQAVAVNSLSTAAGSTVTIQGASTLTIGAGSIAGVVAGSGSLVKDTSGTLTLSGANTYTGTTTISAGTLVASNASALGTTAGGTSIASGATLDVRANIGTEALTSAGGSILTTTGTGTVGGTVALTADTTIGGNGTLNLNGVISGGFGLVKSGTGNTTLGATNTYTGTTTVGAGTLTLSGGSAIVNTGAVVLNGGTLALSAGETIGSLSGVAGTTVTLGANTLTTGDGTDTTFAGVISGTGGLTKQGSGTFTLSGANTYTGSTTVNAGTLTLAGGSAIVNNGAVTLAGSANLTLLASETIGSLGGAAGTTLTLGANTLTTGGNNSSTTFSGVISGTGNLVKQGSGTFTLGGANTYTGTTTVNAGTLAISAIGNLGASPVSATPNALTLNGGTLQVTSTGVTFETNRGITVGSSNGTIDVRVANPNNFTIDSPVALTGKLSFNRGDGSGGATSNVAVNGQISGGGSLVVETPGGGRVLNVTLNASNTFTGGTTLGNTAQTGTNRLILGTDTALGTGTLTVSRGELQGTASRTIANAVSYTGDNLTLGGSNPFTFNGNWTLNTASAKISTNVDATIAGNIGQTGGARPLTKDGPSTLLLSGTNTYTGTTTVSAGALLVNGTNSGTGAVSVNGGVLGGSGSIAGTVTVNAGGSITGGTLGAVGNLTVANLSFNGGTFKADINGDTADQIVSPGTINLNTGVAGTFTVNSVAGTTSAANVFVFLNNTGAGTITGNFSGITEGLGTVINAVAGYFSYVGGLGGNDFICAVEGAPNISANGNLELRTIDASGSPTLQLLENGNIIDSRPLASVTGTYTVTAGAGNDTLTVNYTTVAPATGYFQRNVNFVATGGTDSLIVNGGTFGNITHNTTGAGAGNVAYYSDAAGATLLSSISYSGLESTINNPTSVTNRVFNLPAVTTAATLSDDGNTGNTLSRISASTLVTTDWTNPTGRVTVNAGTASDTLTVNALPNLTAPFTFGSIATPLSTVTVAGAVNVVGDSSIFANTIASNAAISVGTNTLTLNAGTGAITDGNGASNNVTATSLVASAATGIDLDTTVANLTATTSGAGNINLDEADGANVLNVAATNGNATVTSATGALNVTTASASATVTLTATAGAITDGNGATNNITAATALLTAGTSVAAAADPLETTVSNVTISAGGGAFVANTGALSVTSAAGGTGDLTVTSTGALTLAGNVSTSATARLSGTSVTQTGGTLSANALAVRSTGTITLTQSGNNVTTLAAAGNGTVEFTDTNGFALGSVGVSGGFAATAGINSTGNRITLTAGGAVTQTAGISGSSLQLLGNGSYTLTSQALNSVPVIAADLAGGSVNFETTGSLSVGTVNGTVGITTGDPANGGDVRLRSTTGLTVNEDINTQLGAGGVITIGGGVTLAADLVVGQGNIDLGGGGLDIVVTLPTTFNAPVVLAAPRDILVQANLSTTGATSDLTLRAGNDFSDNNAGGVRVYSGATVSSARDLTISGKDLFQSLNTNPADAVLINAGGAVTAARDLSIAFNSVGGWTPTTAVESRTIINGAVSDTGGNISINALNRTELFGTVAGGASGTVTFVAPVLLTGTSSATNTGAITFQSTVDGANDLTVNAGTGTTTFQAAVGSTDPIGDGVGAALTIAGGAATFNGTVAARSGLTQAGTAGLVTFNEDVSINAVSGATPSTFNGNVTLSSMTFSTTSAVAGQGNVTFGDAGSDTVTLAGGSLPANAVTLQTTGGVANTILATAAVIDTNNTLLILSAAPSTSAITFTGANTYNGVTRLDVGTFNLTGSLTGTGGVVELNGADVIFNGGTTGIVEGAGRGVVATGNGDNATVQNFRRIRNAASGGVGVRLAGGSSVRVIDNTGSGTVDGISGSSVNVQTDGGTLFLRGNKINSASAGSSIGLDILGSAVVDAGQDQGGYDFTGLGSGGVAGGSTGGNVFGESAGVGYNGTATGFAIRNRNTNGLNGQSGPQGASFDTYAQGNTFNGTTALSLFGGSYIPIENVVSHDFDNSSWGFVNYVTNGSARPNRITDADGEVLLFMTTGTAAANNNWLQRSMIRFLRVSFDDFVFLGSGATELTRNGTTYNETGGTFSGTVNSGRTGPVVFNPNPVNSAGASNNRYFNYDFEAIGTDGREVSGSLVDGEYTFTLNEDRIQAFVDFSVGDFPTLQVGTGTQSLDFHRLFGDFNGDGVTNTTDRTAFNASYRSTSRMTSYREFFDFDADRDVDGGDLNQFNRRLNRY